MNISELKIRDIRTTIDFEGETIVIKNPTGEIKNELLMFFKAQLNNTMDNASKKEVEKRK